jgi:hypothetical protein
MRLLTRVLVDCPRAFQVLLADAFYCKAPFVNFLWSHHKYTLVVLKDERRDLYEKILGLCEIHKPHGGKISKEKMPLVGCAESDNVAAGKKPYACRTLAGNLLCPAPSNKRTDSGNQRVDVGCQSPAISRENGAGRSIGIVEKRQVDLLSEQTQIRPEKAY